MKQYIYFFAIFLMINACSNESLIKNNLERAEVFLEQNLLNNAVIEIEPGLQYKVMKSPKKTSKYPNILDTITADFHGTLIDGSVFWSSIEIGEPLNIQLAQLIPGCQKAIALMRVGETWRVFIHPDLAYGEEGRPSIPPNSLLIFDISLLAIN